MIVAHFDDDGAPADAFLSADETLLHGLREELGELGHLTDDPDAASSDQG